MIDGLEQHWTFNNAEIAFVLVGAMAFDKDPMSFVQFLLLIALGVVFTLLWVWVDPALAVVLGIVSIGTVVVVVLRFRPRWIKALWAWCIDVGQNSRFIP